ncbi:Fur family transcriptional regulator [Cognatazoarcus halotolerans]|uniref:Fur family transcriptional regulator n=1 Tax=Cognatazoarcus halotolerans TaxID=2686016 RepID=UPI001357D5EB|nr:transcriptional repressor [Cognatazoarcus halotolerans]MBX3679537.1 transcriptional repressor [Rhodocyclaceae bacterium]MCB1900378.1 transcriptional repressor [Rhodocyclaceae bacterium]MCP5308213.1 transcriptional repressor [Zoogloeaceae bacterium]
MSDEKHTDASRLISTHGGRVTRTRVAVLDILLASGQPLAHDEIAAALARDGIAHDRVTLYRNLDWLVEQGIAHRMAGDDRVWRFGVATAAAHEHAHFHCDACGQLFCLKALTPAFAIALPDGYRMNRAELIVHGACPHCSRQSD